MAGPHVASSAASTVTRAYLDACGSDPNFRQIMPQLSLPSAYESSYGKTQFPRPIFADAAALDQLGADLVTLHNLLISLPERAFDGSLDRYLAAINLAPPLVEAICAQVTREIPVYGRADAYHDGTRFRLLEYNLGSELGGMEVGQLNRSYLANPLFRNFSDDHGLQFHDPMVGLVEHFHRQAESIGVGNPVVGLVEGNGSLPGYEHVYAAIQENVSLHGITLHIGEVRDVSFERGRVLVCGHPVDVVLRFYTAPEMADDKEALATQDQLHAAHNAGTIRLIWPLEGALFTSKACLGLLHDPVVARQLDDSEAALVERLVPWTRVLSPGGGATATGRQQLLDRCLADQRDLVIKPGIGYGGKGTVIGSEVSRQQWSQTLDDSLGTDWVVQHKVTAALEPVLDPETGELQQWVANWGVFVDDEGYNGAFVRALRPSDGSVVAYSNPGTRGACVFGVPATPAEPAQGPSTGQTRAR